MRLVILESPFRGRTDEEAARNKRYAAACMLDALRRGESPLASHLMWPGILDDASAVERMLGIEAGLAWGKVAAATTAYQDLGISEGMTFGINRARSEGRPVEFRSLLGWLEKERAAEAAPSQQNASVGSAAA